LLLHAVVHTAEKQDRDGGVLLMSTLFGLFPFLASFMPIAATKGRSSGRA
jgi:hypothetical protein